MMDEQDKKVESAVPESLIQEALNVVESAPKKKHKKGYKSKPAPAGELAVEVSSPQSSVSGQAAPSEPQEPAPSAKEKEYYERLLRLAADFDNYKKRAAREKEELTRYAAEKLLLDLLPLSDNFQRALAITPPEGDRSSLYEGLLLIQRQLENMLKSHGVERIEALGRPFDPLYHEAVTTRSEAEKEPELVLEVLQEGYLHNGRLLRPCKVVVNQPQPAAAASSPATPGQEETSE